MSGALAFKAIEEKREAFERLALEAWSIPETAFNEVNTCRATAKLCQELGFETESGAFGLPTAVYAKWGSGYPVIGFLGELDALSGLSQKVSTEEAPVDAGAPGHGCGHNLLVAAPLIGAYGLKEELRQKKLSGTVVYYGCPAEETLNGKPFLARGGAFRELDIAFSWHGSDSNNVGYGRGSGLNNAIFHFSGCAAHAGYAPQDGRSALDAVELMNIGANYLREHVTTDTRIHYVITEGGQAPNIVPDKAAVWYFNRGASRESVVNTYHRLINIAAGAAKMTDTTFHVEFLGGCHDTMPNHVLVDLLHECMFQSGLPQWTEEELAFADAINKSSPMYEQLAAEGRAPQPLATEVEPIRTPLAVSGSSTDVADVMHIVPTALLNTTTSSSLSGAHNWRVTACSGHAIGLKGMMYGGRTLALAAIRAVENPEIIERAKTEFRKAMCGWEYVCPIPDDVLIPQPD